jgi:glycosyltransferase involved in cell wall biosynthesis
MFLYDIMPPKQNKKASKYPMVSVCTPTFNRRPFIPTMLDCFRHQDYPMSRIEWIIIDDGTDKIQDLIDEANIPQIKYFPIEERMLIGKKRNLMHEKCTGAIIVYMNDDDYYPPERISHAVDTLKQNPSAMCAGSSTTHIYFNHIRKIYKLGPYGHSHATAATFAFRKDILETSKYDNCAAIAGEDKFLNNYTVPFVQLDPMKTILVFSHNHNTFDKRKMIDKITPEMNNFVRETTHRVSDFVKNDSIRNFITNKVDILLDKYEPGDPKHKPEVQQQLIELIQQKQTQRRLQQEENGPIVMKVNDSEPTTLSNAQVREILTAQNKKINELYQIIENMKTDINRHVEEAKFTQESIELRDRNIKEVEEEVSNNETEIASVD